MDQRRGGGGEGLTGLRRRVVLLDIGLPGGSGMDVLRQLSDAGALARTRVIVVTGNDDECQAWAGSSSAPRTTW